MTKVYFIGKLFGKKQVKSSFLNHSNLFVQKKEKIDGYSFPSMKKHKIKLKPKISLSFSYEQFELRKFNDNLFFGEVRIPREEHQEKIIQLEDEVKKKQEELQQYLMDNFFSFELLSFDKVKQEVIKPEYKENTEKRIREVLNQKGWGE
jgi:hypothetical protein